MLTFAAECRDARDALLVERAEHAATKARLHCVESDLAFAQGRLQIVDDPKWQDIAFRARLENERAVISGSPTGGRMTEPPSDDELRAWLSEARNSSADSFYAYRNERACAALLAERANNAANARWLTSLRAECPHETRFSIDVEPPIVYCTRCGQLSQ